MTKPTENELFEKWAIDYGLDWEPNFTRLDVETAWHARAELADKQIAELKARLKIELKLAEDDSNKIGGLRTRLKELQTNINELREALEAECGGRCNAEYNPCRARQALAKTAPQCLIEHDNEVIERCALALENVEGELKYLPEYVSVIRKLKG